MESQKALEQIKDLVLSSMASLDVQIYLFGVKAGFNLTHLAG